jgi:hypothetical protein
MTYIDGFNVANLHLDAKCGKGWEGVKGRCKRSRLLQDPLEDSQKIALLKKAIGVALIVGYGTRVAKTAAWGVRAGQARLSAEIESPDNLNIVKPEELKALREIEQIGTGQAGDVFRVKSTATGDEYAWKRQRSVGDDLFQGLHGEMYLYTSAMEAVSSEMGREVGVSTVETKVIPSAKSAGEDVFIASTLGEVGYRSLGSVLQGIAKGRPLSELKDEFKTGRLPVPPEADFIVGGVDIFRQARGRREKKGWDKKQGLTIGNLKAMEHQDAAKIMALDTFLGNSDRHLDNLFYDSDTDSFTAIDNGQAYLNPDLTRRVARSLNNTKKYREILKQNPEMIDGLTTYRDTLQQLYVNNPPRKTKKRLMGYLLTESRSGMIHQPKDFLNRLNKLLMVEKNYQQSKLIIERLNSILAA